MANVFTPAGVAAALAASMTVFVAHSDGAFAAPPTVQVDVANPATNPALTRSVDDPGRIAYQNEVACVANVNQCFFNFPAVPTNHRLVVQHVSGALVFLADTTAAEVFLQNGANQALSAFLAPPSFQQASLFDQPVLQYFDAGSAPFVLTRSDVDPAGNSQMTISGYLLDCATTPCEAIAH
jgi:hypothetical protein